MYSFTFGRCVFVVASQVVVPPPRLGAGRYGAVGMAATYQSFVRGATQPALWDGVLRSEALLARYATLLSHTYSLVFVHAHNVSGRLVVAQAPSPAPTTALPAGPRSGGDGVLGPSSEVEAAPNGDGSSSRGLELRVYTPLAHCRTHRLKLSIDQVHFLRRLASAARPRCWGKKRGGFLLVLNRKRSAIARLLYEPIGFFFVIATPSLSHSHISLSFLCISFLKRFPPCFAAAGGLTFSSPAAKRTLSRSSPSSSSSTTWSRRRGPRSGAPRPAATRPLVGPATAGRGQAALAAALAPAPAPVPAAAAATQGRAEAATRAGRTARRAGRRR